MTWRDTSVTWRDRYRDRYTYRYRDRYTYRDRYRYTNREWRFKTRSVFGHRELVKMLEQKVILLEKKSSRLVPATSAKKNGLYSVDFNNLPLAESESEF